MPRIIALKDSKNSLPGGYVLCILCDKKITLDREYFTLNEFFEKHKNYTCDDPELLPYQTHYIRNQKLEKLLK